MCACVYVLSVKTKKKEEIQPSIKLFVRYFEAVLPMDRSEINKQNVPVGKVKAF